MDNSSSRARCWRVTLADGRTIEVVAVRLIETANGSLLFVDRQRQPVRVIARENWKDCFELRNRREPRVKS